MNKICVYTCITGDYDNLIDIQNIEQGIDYICYTNNKKIKSKTWKVKYVVDNTLTDAELNRKIKILGDKELKKYDVTVYIDGNFTIVGSIKKLIEENVDLKKYDFVGFKHSVRNSINEEMLACLMYNKENIENISKLYDFYNHEKFPDNNGLIEASILIRNFNNDKLNECMKLWFDMYINYAHRDQLSFQYAAWKTGLKYDLLDMSVWDNEYFDSKPHYKVAKVRTRAFSFYENKIIDIKEDEFEVENSKLNLKFENVHKGIQYIIQIESDKNMTFDFIGGGTYYELIFQQCVSIKDKIYSGTKVVVIVSAKRNMKLLQVCLPIYFSDDIYKLLDEVNNELFNSRNIIKYNEYLIQKVKDEFNDLENKYKKLNEKYVKIVNTRGWKMLEKLRHALKKD